MATVIRGSTENTYIYIYIFTVTSRSSRRVTFPNSKRQSYRRYAFPPPPIEKNEGRSETRTPVPASEDRNFVAVSTVAVHERVQIDFLLGDLYAARGNRYRMQMTNIQEHSTFRSDRYARYLKRSRRKRGTGARSRITRRIGRSSAKVVKQRPEESLSSRTGLPKKLSNSGRKPNKNFVAFTRARSSTEGEVFRLRIIAN